MNAKSSRACATLALQVLACGTPSAGTNTMDAAISGAPTAGASASGAGGSGGAGSGAGASGSSGTGMDAAIGDEGDGAAVVCNDGACSDSESCRSCKLDCGPCTTAPFGSLDIHPEKLGIYAIPDLPPQYTDWVKLKLSLSALHSLVPDAWIRWDNETGHYSDTPANVEAFVDSARYAGIPMIITASAVDGYDNWWAAGNKQPTVSISQIADGPYLAHADLLRRNYDNVRFIETINEPDTMWFVADPDDVAHWDYYMSKLYAATQNDYEHILGPAVAFKHSKIWESHAARSELAAFSYHTYAGYQGLEEVGDKRVYVTEYGSDSVSAEIGDSPGFILSDLRNAELAGKLSGKIERIFYVNLQKMMRADLEELGHFAFSAQLRVLSLYAALGAIGKHVHVDPVHTDILAADDRSGVFGALLWNDSSTAEKSGESRHVPATSLLADAPLYVLHLFNGVMYAAQCSALADQSWLAAGVNGDALDVEILKLEPLSAVLLTTEPCDSLAK